MRYIPDNIEGYITLLNRLYAYKEGWINFNEVIDLMCSLIKKDRNHLVHEFEGISRKGYREMLNI